MGTFYTQLAFFSLILRSVSYTINGHHKGHVIVLAEVVTVALSISTDKVSLLPTPGLPPEAGELSVFCSFIIYSL